MTRHKVAHSYIIDTFALVGIAEVCCIVETPVETFYRIHYSLTKSSTTLPGGGVGGDLYDLAVHRDTNGGTV